MKEKGQEKSEGAHGVDMDCKHFQMNASVKIGRIIAEGQELALDGTPKNYIAEIRVNCKDCGEPFHFVGVPVGLSWEHPAVSPDSLELRAPLQPGPKMQFSGTFQTVPKG